MRVVACLTLFFCLLLPSDSPGAEETRPNILIAISDDQSWAHTSAAGYDQVQTPAFDRVAQLGGMFRQAFGASPGCSPCRAALLTGRHTWQIEEAGTHASSFPRKYRVFPELLAEAGYHAGYTGKGWGPGNFKVSGWDQNPAGKSYAKRKAADHPPGTSNNDYAANFADFLAERQKNQPFVFWYGATEPHRGYADGIGKKSGKDLTKIKVPGFLPEAETIRSDIADYLVEIEWFDQHLGRMLDQLEQMGELENTLVIVTSDNGMPFPRAKANCYEYGIHMPLAICWPSQMPGGRTVDDLIGFVDLTATILDAAQVSFPADAPGLSGRSLVSLLKSEKSGICEPQRDAVYSARERHSSSRYQNWTYPQRSLRTHEYLLVHNFRPERWPAGAPQKFDKPGILGPPHGGYHDIDGGPSLSYLVNHRDDPEVAPFFHLAVDRRPEYELFDVRSDADCLRNLAGDEKHAKVFTELKARLQNYLRETGDPRELDGGEIYETYRRFSGIRDFPEPTAVE